MHPLITAILRRTGWLILELAYAIDGLRRLCPKKD